MIRDAQINEQDRTITITLDLDEPRPSSTGKSLLVATSGGTTPLPIQHPNGETIKATVSAFIPNK